MIKPAALFTPAPERATLDRPLEHLLACHRRIEERLDTLERAAAHLHDRRDEALAAFHSAFAFLDTSGALHTADEEESLFPRLYPLLEMGERSYLAGLEHDHTEAHLMYTRLKSLIAAPGTGDAWLHQTRGLVENLAAHYRRHIASEDETLQSYAAERLGAAALAEIAGEMRARRK
jgi:hemerythrin-like domain-containing protein